ncbi:MAG TPA: MFS transporter [Isosphaeraceae bacterium]|jgi:MFS family permease
MRKRTVVLVLLVLASTITFLDRIAISAAGPRMQDELGISLARWGWVQGAFILAYGLFEVPTGAMGDRAGQRRVLTRIVAWWSLFTALTGSVSGFVPLLITRFLFGAGEAGAYPNMAGSVARWFPEGERARAQGVIWGASRAGGALAPLLVITIQEAYGWRASFWILGIVGLAWAAAWHGWYRDEPAAQPGITEAELREIGTEPGTHARPEIPWAGLARSPRLWLILAAYGCYAWGSWFYFSWLHTYLVRGRGFTEEQMKYYAALPFVLGAAANVVGGVMTDGLARRHGRNIGRRLVTSACLTATALLLVVAALARGPMTAVLALSLGLGVMDLMLPAAWALCLDLAPRYAGAVTGAMNMAGQVGGFACTMLFGTIVVGTGSYHAPLVLIAAMLLISAFLFACIDPTRPLVADETTVETAAIG